VLEKLAHIFKRLPFAYVKSFNGIFLRFPLFFGVYSRPSHLGSRLYKWRWKHHRQGCSFLHDGIFHNEICNADAYKFCRRNSDVVSLVGRAYILNSRFQSWDSRITRLFQSVAHGSFDWIKHKYPAGKVERGSCVIIMWRPIIGIDFKRSLHKRGMGNPV
jgi:hypothetical protein